MTFKKSNRSRVAKPLLLTINFFKRMIKFFAGKKISETWLFYSKSGLSEYRCGTIYI